MFCVNCGEKNIETAKYCHSCGFKINGTKGANAERNIDENNNAERDAERNIDGNNNAERDAERNIDENNNAERDADEMILEINPVFIPIVSLVGIIPVILFMTIWCGGFFGISFSFGLQFINKFLPFVIPSFVPFIFFGSLALFGIPIITYFVKKKTYAKTKFTFYKNYLEYYEGFWNFEKKNISYDRIIECNLYQGIIQRKYNLGSVVLSTNAFSYVSKYGGTGIVIKDIENSEKIFNMISKIVKKR